MRRPDIHETERAEAGVVRDMRVPARTEVTVEPVRSSALRKSVGHIPLLRRMANREDYLPAKLRRKRTPAVPLELSRKLRRDEPVVVRVKIAKNGQVSKAELVSRKANPAFASIMVRAAAAWDFEPARAGNKAIASDILVHFRFRPASY